MPYSHHLYCLSAFEQTFDLQNAPAERTYKGQLVFSGPDAAIEIRGSMIRGYIDGAPSHPEGQLAAMIDNYDRSILRGARALRRDKADTVILSGKWHHIEFDEEPRFEAYLVHVVSPEGAVSTRRYRSEIFDWDDPGLNNGGGFGYTLRGQPDEDPGTLRHLAARKLGGGRRFRYGPGGLPALDGILWFPASKATLPIVASMFRDDIQLAEFEGETEKSFRPGQGPVSSDGTILSALKAREAFVGQAIGEFRGTTVDRRAHRPEEMTLDEILDSTDTPGYWSQSWYDGSEPYSVFHLPHDALLDGNLVLKRTSDEADPYLLGNTYASDWSAAENNLFRVLAVGPAPDHSRVPL
ncbi:hypothetical protein [Pararhizobium arenae]|uniref:hypothetical protein n=1 Tax=Pararhizobium arenae TaxID=1856850 RepID=UPI00094B6242|nr:hypothetical protein [Pararhizobium arenae]